MKTSSLEATLHQARCLLFSFNGPICTLYTDENRVHNATNSMRQILRDNNINIPDTIRAETNPLNILRFTKKLERIQLLFQVEDALRAAELAAVPTAAPTPGARQAIIAAHWSSRRVAIVSNVSPEAIHAYLESQRIDNFVHPVVGRAYGDPIIYKPSPSPAAWAMHQLQAKPNECIFIGTTATDFETAAAARVPAIMHSTASRAYEYISKPQTLFPRDNNKDS